MSRRALSAISILIILGLVFSGVLRKPDDPRIGAFAELVAELKAVSEPSTRRERVEGELVPALAELELMAKIDPDQPVSFARAYSAAVRLLEDELFPDLEDRGHRHRLWKREAELYASIGKAKYAMFARLWLAMSLVQGDKEDQAEGLLLSRDIAGSNAVPGARVGALLLLFRTYLDQKETDLAVEIAERIRNENGGLYADAWSLQDRAVFLSLEADLWISEGRPDTAAKSLEEAAPVIQELKDPEETRVHLMDRMQVNIALARVDASIADAEELLKVTSEPAEKASILLEKAMAHSLIAQRGQLPSFGAAILSLREALVLDGNSDRPRREFQLQVLTRLARYSALSASRLVDGELPVSEARKLRARTLAGSTSLHEQIGSLEADLRLWEEEGELDSTQLQVSLRQLSFLALRDAQLVAQPFASSSNLGGKRISGWLAYLYGVRGRHEFDLLDREEQEHCVAEMGVVAARLLDAWRASMASGSELAFLKYPHRRILLGEMLRAQLSLGVEPAQLLRELQRFQACGALAHRAGYEIESLAAIQKELVPEDGVVLNYVLGLDRGLVISVESEEVGAFELSKGLAGVASSARLFRLHTLEGSAVEVRARHSRVLADVLIPAAVERGFDRWKGICVVGLEGVGLVPFEWLVLDGKPLFHRCAVSYLPTIPVGMLVARRESLRPPSNGKWLLFGDPVLTEAHLGKKAVALPESRVQRWSGVLQASELVSRVGAEATPAGLIAGDSAAGRVLTVITHGGYDRRLSQPVLAVSGAEAWLRPPMLRAMTSSCRAAPKIPGLVTLYACEGSAKQRRLGQDGSQGFAGSFLELGAHSVLLASERLSVGFVYSVSELFDRKLVEAGLSPAAALQQVLIENGEALQKRQAALGFLRLVGLSHRPVFER